MGTYINGLWYADDQVELARDGTPRPKTGFVHSALAGMPEQPVAESDAAADESAAVDPAAPVVDAEADAIPEAPTPDADAAAGGAEDAPGSDAKERDPARFDKQRHPVTRDKGAFGAAGGR